MYEILLFPFLGFFSFGFVSYGYADASQRSNALSMLSYIYLSENFLTKSFPEIGFEREGGHQLRALGDHRQRSAGWKRKDRQRSWAARTASLAWPLPNGGKSSSLTRGFPRTCVNTGS